MLMGGINSMGICADLRECAWGSSVVVVVGLSPIQHSSNVDLQASV